MNTEITQQETVESTTYQGREVRLCSDGKNHGYDTSTTIKTITS